MKTKIFVAALLMLALPMTATNKKNEFTQQKKRLTGIWQQCFPMTANDGSVQLRFTPHFKILNSDGTFCNMSQANSLAPAALFATGEWRVTSEKTFVEHLTTNAKSVYEGKDNELTFRLTTNDNILEISYTMPGDQRLSREIWMRVQEGDAMNAAQKYFQELQKKEENISSTPVPQNRFTGNPTQNPRGIYKLMAIKGGIQEINPYPNDIYKICTDNVTMRLNVVKNNSFKTFRIDHSDPEIFNYTGERIEADNADKSKRIFDSDDKHFTLKWWSMLQNSAYYPYNNWSYEYYESGKYSEAARPIADMLTSAPARDANNPLIGTWQYAMKIDKIEGEGQDNWIEELKKVDNIKEVLTYLSQTEPGESKQYQVYTPSYFFTMRMSDNMKEMMGAYDKITYNGKESVTAPGGEVMEIHWLTDDFFAIRQPSRNKVVYRVWERVSDDQTILNRIENWFLKK